jgi:DNA-binding XRE family transcriptional regulator
MAAHVVLKSNAGNEPMGIERIRRDRHLTEAEAERLRRIRAEEDADKRPGADFVAFLESVQGIAAMLRAARESAGLSLADMAERTGMTKPALSRLETGERENPTIATLGRYAAALGKRVRFELVPDNGAGSSRAVTN